jgi:hypothetical protein
MKILIRIIGDQAEIRTEHLWNTSLVRYRCANPLGIYIYTYYRSVRFKEPHVHITQIKIRAAEAKVFCVQTDRQYNNCDTLRFVIIVLAYGIVLARRRAP